MKKVMTIFLIILSAIILQGLWCYLIYKSRECLPFVVPIISRVFSILFVIFIVVGQQKVKYILFWSFVILIFPVLGIVLYIFFANKNVMDDSRENGLSTIGNDILKESKNIDIGLCNIIKNVSLKCDLPILYNKRAEYFSSGEEIFENMLKELENAKENIYVEYFSIEEGYFWNKLVELFKKKVKENVDIRIISDDYKSMSNSIKNLRDNGIKYASFNPLALKGGILNNRGHRKMAIIDNKIVYSGGINIADEYIKKIEKYGYYKDIGFRLEGDGVYNYLSMFVDSWNKFSNDKTDNAKSIVSLENKDYDEGFVLSYYDTPTVKYQNSYNLYIDLLYQSKKYIWFYTPYLALTDELRDALIRCAKRGVDVRIITPGVPDKKMIKKLTTSYYNGLIEGGVKIYEFKDGFIHAKACIMDDFLCTIGSVNLDYRSLFLDYENNSIFISSSIVSDLRDDFESTFNKCKEIKLEKKSLIDNMVANILRICSPVC